MGSVADAIGARVRTRRVAAGLSQEQLGVAAGVAGRTVARVEAAEDTTLGTLVAIADALGVTLADLVDDRVQRRAS